MFYSSNLTKELWSCEKAAVVEYGHKLLVKAPWKQDYERSGS